MGGNPTEKSGRSRCDSMSLLLFRQFLVSFPAAFPLRQGPLNDGEHTWGGEVPVIGPLIPSTLPPEPPVSPNEEPQIAIISVSPDKTFRSPGQQVASYQSAQFRESVFQLHARLSSSHARWDQLHAASERWAQAPRIL